MVNVDAQSSPAPLGESQVALYLTTLTHRRVRAAQLLIESTLRAGATPADIRLRLFQPALRELGDLFQTERLSLSDCDFVLDATQWLMARLPETSVPPRTSRPRMTIGCAPGEAHRIGMEMVAAHFTERGGWEVTVLGPGLSETEFVEQVAATLPDLAAISVTTTGNLPSTGSLVRALRRERVTHPIPIMVGGLPFLDSTSLCRVVLADCYGRDAADGLARAERFLSQNCRASLHSD